MVTNKQTSNHCWHGLKGRLYGSVWFWVKSTLLRGMCSAVYAKEGFGDIQRRWLYFAGRAVTA